MRSAERTAAPSVEPASRAEHLVFLACTLAARERLNMLVNAERGRACIRVDGLPKRIEAEASLIDWRIDSGRRDATRWPKVGNVRR